MDELWEDAVNRFHLLTGEKLPTGRSVSFDDLKQRILERSRGADEANNPARNKANDTILTTLKYVQILGGVVAQAASAVYGTPSELCFNAVGALLNIPQTLRDYHDEVDAIFAEVGPTLAQFKIYGRIELFSSLDSDLLSTINLVFISLVDICAKCINLKSDPSRWSRFKKGTKRVLLNDGELRDELETFKDLVRRQQSVQSALTLEAALDSNQKLTSLLSMAGETGEKVTSIDRNVGILMETDRVFRFERTKAQKMIKIRSFLGIPENASDDSKPIYEDTLKRSVLPNKGKWWFEGLVAYQDWADRESRDTSPCLLLTGNPNSGKSFSVVAMISHLMAEHLDDAASGHRMLLAYSFFSATAGKNDDERRRLRTALKWIAVQLAEQDASYAAHLMDSLVDSRRNVQNMTNEQLWGFLKIASPRPKTTHYIILDGFEKLSLLEQKQLLDMLRTLPSTRDGPCPIRVLASGTPASLVDLHSVSGWPTIQMEQYNLETMRDYTSHIMGDEYRSHPRLRNKVDEALIRPEVFMINLALNQTTSQDIRRVVSEVRELIRSGTQDDKSTFSDVYGALDELTAILATPNASESILVRNARQHLEQSRQRLRSKDRTKKVTFRGIQITLDEVKRLMSNGGSERDLDRFLVKSAVDTWKPDVQKHEQRLDGRQIKLLNELLIWVTFGRYYFSVDDLESALLLRSRDVPLEGLHAFIDRKLTGIMYIDAKGFVQLMPDTKEEVVRNRSTPRSRHGPSTISLQISINNAPLPAVQRFLWDLAEHATFDKFTFSQDATSVSTGKPKIGIYSVDAQLAFVDATLELLTGPADPRLHGVGWVLLSSLPYHLKSLQEATELDDIDHDEKGRIGKAIYDLFDDVGIIERHWSYLSSTAWFEINPHFDTIIALITDEATSTRLSRKDKAWLQEIRNDEVPASKLLHPLSLMIARLWLRTREGLATKSFLWVANYLALAIPPDLQPAVDSYHAGLQAARPDAEASQTVDSTEREPLEGDDDHPEPKLEGDDEDKLERLRSRYMAFFQSTTAARIEAAVSWCESELQLSESDHDSLYHERLGATFAADELDEKAVEHYEMAMAKPNPSWNVLHGLATSLWSLCERSEASRIMESALADSEFKKAISTDETISMYTKAAQYFNKVATRDKAFQCYKDVHELRPDDLRVQCGLLEYYFSFGREEDAKRIILPALGDAESSPERSVVAKAQLASMLNFIIEVDSRTSFGYLFSKIADMAKSYGHVDVLLHEIDGAADHAHEQRRHFERALLLIWKGMVKFHEGDLGPQLALRLWEESAMIAKQHLEKGSWEQSHIWSRTTRLQGQYYLKEATRPSEEPKAHSHQHHVDKLIELVKHSEVGDIPAPVCYLSAYHCSRGDSAAARASLQSSMRTALSMLSDGDGANDREGLSLMTEVLIHAGDGRNTDICHHLLAPIQLAGGIMDVLRMYLSEAAKTNKAAAEAMQSFEMMEGKGRPLRLVEKILQDLSTRQGLTDDVGDIRRPLAKLAMTVRTELDITCDGCLVARWDMNNELHVCYCCPNTYFCTECVNKVKEGRGNLLFCDPSHSWMLLGKWTMDKWMNYLRDEVQPSAGGEKVTLSAWLTEIVKDWGLEEQTWDFARGLY